MNAFISVIHRTAQLLSITGRKGEVTYDEDKDTLVSMDGTTYGGRPILREDLTNLDASDAVVINNGAIVCHDDKVVIQ